MNREGLLHALHCQLLNTQEHTLPYRAWLLQLQEGNSQNIRMHAYFQRVINRNDKIHQRLIVAKDEVVVTEILDNANIMGGLTVWASQQVQEFVTPIWTNMSIKRNDDRQSSNLYSYEQLLAMFNHRTNIEIHNQNYYAISTTNLVPQLHQAVKQLANNVYQYYQEEQQRQRTRLDNEQVRRNKEAKYNLHDLDKVIEEDPYFSKAASKALLCECLEIGIKEEPLQYPSDTLRERLQYTLQRTEVKKSTIAGAGRQLCRHIRSH